MLTTKQFIKKVNELGYGTNFMNRGFEESEYVYIYMPDKNEPQSISGRWGVASVHTSGKRVRFCDSSLRDDTTGIFSLIGEYLSTPDHERNAEEKYYIYWCDFSGVFYFLSDIAINDPDNFSNNTGFESLGNLITCEKDDIHHYQLTESDIKQLPNQWIPSEFGGIGFTRIISVD